MKIFVTGAAGFIGGSVAAGLVRAGHQVTGLVRKPEQLADLAGIGVTGVVGTLNDRELLIAQAQAADAVINAASSDNRAAVEAFIDALAGSGKVFLHTSGSSIVGDASGGEGTDRIYLEDQLPAPTADKAARVAIDDLVLAAAGRGVRSAVLCNTLIYGHGALPRDMSTAIARAMNLGEPQDWPLEQAKDEWGYEMASYGLGSNSRVRGERARQQLGWAPHRPPVLDWIAGDMLRG